MATSKQIEEIIIQTQGTCNQLDEAIQNVLGTDCDDSDLTQEELGEIDQEIFNCSTCNWWYEICEQSEDGETCEDCKECEVSDEEE